jgi:hypothetical protein
MNSFGSGLYTQDLNSLIRQFRIQANCRDCICHIYNLANLCIQHWDEIQQVARHNRTAPAGKPESINHQRPPPQYSKNIFETGASGKKLLQGSRCQPNPQE